MYTNAISSAPGVPSLESGLGLSLDSTFGAYLLGTFFSLPLYGLSIHQFYRYCRLYPRDAKYIRIVVVTVMLLETVHATMLMHSCYYYLTTNYDDILALLKQPVWSAAIAPLVSAIISLVSEIFFARRVFMLGSTYKIVAVSAIVCFLAQIGFSTDSVVQLYQAGIFGGLSVQTLSWVAPAGYGCAAFADILLSGCIIRALRLSRANHERTDSILDVLMLYVVNTGFLIGLCSTVAFILAVASSNALRWTAFNIITSRLCANTLLSVLNSRKLFISRGMEILDGKSLGRNIIARANELAEAERWNVPQIPDNSVAQINVGVKTEIESDSCGERLESDGCPRLHMDFKGTLLKDV